MRIKTRLPHSKSTIRKLRLSAFILMDKYGKDVTLDDHPQWYSLAGITAKTFAATIRTYDNYLAIEASYLQAAVTGLLRKISLCLDMDEALKIFMRIGTSSASSYSRAQRHVFLRESFKFAILRFPLSKWLNVMAPLKIVANEEYERDPETLDLLFNAWALICQYIMLGWVGSGMKAEDAGLYREQMLKFYGKIFSLKKEDLIPEELSILAQKNG